MWQSGVKCALDTGHGQCKGPGVVACGTMLREPQGGVCGMGEEGLVGDGRRCWMALWGIWGTLASTLSEEGSS